MIRGLLTAAAVAALGATASELRLERTLQPLGTTWRTMPIESRGATPLGVSIRTPQLDAFGLDPRSTLKTLLDYPFELVRLGAYWRRIEPAPIVFDPRELDAQIEAAATADKRIILGVGALKTFGYPEFFAPSHVVASLPEHTRIRADTYRAVLDRAIEFIQTIVERYKHNPSVVAWQVEHESVDPLGFEHSWRLDRGFVEAEVRAARDVDPTRPILMNGFLPVSILGGLSQWWQTRDQGDSLAVAEQLADIVGVDFYPRVGLFSFGPYTVYLDGSRSPWQLRRFGSRKRLMVSEGQAEPWETVVIPPGGAEHAPASCTPANLIDNYNRCMRWAKRKAFTLEGYVFWGAEYWMVRRAAGDTSYLQAFERVLQTSA